MLDAFKRPFTNLKAFAISSLIGAIPILGLLMIISYVLENLNKRKIEDWNFSKIGNYLMNCLVVVFYSLVYFFVPLILIIFVLIFAFGFDKIILQIINSTNYLEAVNILTQAISISIVALLIVIIAYIITSCANAAALLKYAKNKKITLSHKFFLYFTNLKFLLYFILGIIYIGILISVANLFFVVPLIGLIIGSIANGAALYIGYTTMYTMLAKFVR